MKSNQENIFTDTEDCTQDPRVNLSDGLNRLRSAAREKNKHPMQKNFENNWYKGNGEDGKHYWLTPPDLMKELQLEFNFDFDPCPFPKPDNFDGLDCEWGKRNYVNPPFGSIIHNGKKVGPTAWARKAIAEYGKGKKVVFVYPIDKWILMMIQSGATVRNLGDVKWCATEDGTPGKGTGRHIAMFVLDPEKQAPQ